jgi:hypothetical protein
MWELKNRKRLVIQLTRKHQIHDALIIAFGVPCAIIRVDSLSLLRLERDCLDLISDFGRLILQLLFRRLLVAGGGNQFHGSNAIDG